MTSRTHGQQVSGASHSARGWQRVLVLLASAATLLLASAETYIFGPADQPVWDPSGTYQESLDDLDIWMTLYTDSAGVISGGGTFELSGSLQGVRVYLTGGLDVSGKIKTAGTLTRLDLKLRMDGSGFVQGYQVYFTANVTERLEIEAGGWAEGVFWGKVSVKIPGEGSGSQSMPKTYTSMWLDTDGVWHFVVNTQVDPTNAKRLVGLGTADLGGRTLRYTVSGKVNPKTGETKLKLSPSDDASARTKIQAVLVGPDGQRQLQALKGKVLGQKLKTE